MTVAKLTDAALLRLTVIAPVEPLNEIPVPALNEVTPPLEPVATSAHDPAINALSFAVLLS